ncbi:3-hydroxyacyl-CoA dehydrogenase [Rhizobium sp. CF080]|uniref:3-hydroxyacyl-CoA dehydrogenase NAD-binding domain-containing protein n=1 Tax=Rhizobium sp. (strain CF080) TaxID=1144310 RepID=UPI0002716F82|nr:3-hydroxyacyl-CoA dehydrogenase NAD-binding domain-containing protein [Rhizobium sp. CF080]EUB99355.1 3-hydroxyacyl-CoA dehydrogenase [Rhizobium sp. CF080]
MSAGVGRFRSEDIETVAIIGAGLIGGAWAAFFLSRGLKVRVYDTDPEGARRLEKVVGNALEDLRQVGSVAPVAADALFFSGNLEEVLAGCDYIQENAPEKLPLKQALLKQITDLTPSDVVIGSSTSSFQPSELQAGGAEAERIVVAHPFNPPHLLPLVEIVAGPKSNPEAQAAVYRFFERLGKAPIRITREAAGHVANRMTAALWREAVHIVAEGIASVEDVDRAIRFGPGLRWAVDGPHMLYHLGGGEGGIAHYLKHLGPAQEARWRSLGNPSLTEDVQSLLIDGVMQEAAGRSIEELGARRDRLLIALLKVFDDGPISGKSEAAE